MTELHNCVLIFSCSVLLVLVGDVFFGTTFCTALAKSAAVGKGFSLAAIATTSFSLSGVLTSW
ncbi:MAG: hypothetical protein V7K45_07850 [Nostoc sp.]